MKANDLTILLTLKGRHLHTLRWLWHADRIRLPFHVIVADGEVHPAIARLLSNPDTFPNLSFEYHRYDDKSYSEFFRKCVDALGKVRTPYVMMSDNDDFLFASGLQKSLAFLEGAPAYVCAGAGIPGFSIDPQQGPIRNLVGTFGRICYRYINDGSYRCRDLDNPSVALRTLDELNNYHSIYYSVYRIQILRLISEEIQAHDFSDLDIHERYWALRTVTLGRARSDPSHFSCFRQQGTSLQLSFTVDWVHHLLRSRVPQDFAAMASTIAREAAKTDGSDQSELEERIREGYASILRRMLAGTMMRHRFPRLFALKQRLLALPRFRIPAPLRRKLDKKKLWEQLAADGATAEQIVAHARELDDIEATLQGDEFIEFVSRNAPELLATA